MSRESTRLPHSSPSVTCYTSFRDRQRVCTLPYTCRLDRPYIASRGNTPFNISTVTHKSHVDLSDLKDVFGYPCEFVLQKQGCTK